MLEGTPHCIDVHGVQGAEEDSNSLHFLSHDLREKLLQKLLERRLKLFTADVRP